MLNIHCIGRDIALILRDISFNFSGLNVHFVSCTSASTLITIFHHIISFRALQYLSSQATRYLKVMYAYELQETKRGLTGSRIPYLSPSAVVVGEEGICSYKVP